MYKSPIETFQTGIEYQFENDIMNMVQKYGITVDKDELLRALRYDRDQYLAGYAEGYKDGLNASPWISVEDELPNKNDTYLVTNGKTITTMWFSFPNGFTAFSKPSFCVWDNSGDGWYVKSTFPTHWARLPELPKKDEEK